MNLSNRFHFVLLVLGITLFALPVLAGVNAGGGGAGTANVPLSSFAHLFGYGGLTIAMVWKQFRS